MDPGWIYILTNPSYPPDWLKIGRTANDPADRASAISGSTGVVMPFDVAYAEAVPDCVRAENLIHSKLADRRVSAKREFFQLDLPSAREAVHQVCEAVRGESVLCRQCRTRSDLRSTEAELDQKTKEVRRLETCVQKAIAKQERTAKRYRRLRRRVRRRFLVDMRRSAFRVLWLTGRIARTVVTAVRFRFRKMIPNRIDRAVIVWILAPVICAGWTVLLVYRFRTALGVVLTVLAVAATMVIAGVQPERRDMQPGRRGRRSVNSRREID